MEIDMYYFIVNVNSGSGKGANVWRVVSSVLRARKVEYRAYKTRYKGHATDLAKKISENGIAKNKEGKTKIIIVGGDGTLNEVINGISDFSKIEFGVIPTGSGNDFARGMSISKDVEKTINRLLNASETVCIDLGCVRVLDEDNTSERLFAVSSGIGMDAEVCKRALDGGLKRTLNRYGIGALTYIIHTLQALFSLNDNNVSITFTHKMSDGTYMDITEKWNKYVFSAIMNFSCEGGGVPMAPNADAKDGKLSVCTGHGVDKWQTFLILPFLAMGKHSKIGFFDIRNVVQIKIENDKLIQLHTDGEYCGMVKKVEYEVLEKKMSIIV